MALSGRRFILLYAKRARRTDEKEGEGSMFRIVCVLIGYLIGCLQSAYVVGKCMHVDIRKHGSGNLGSTNALRVLGKRAGLITFTCDICKAVAAYFLCSFLFHDTAVQNNLGYTVTLAGLYGCAGTVLGHDFPFYLSFKGGKGIASMIGMMLCLGYGFGFPSLFAFGFGVVGLLTKYVSVGSMLFSAAIPAALYIFGYPLEFTGVAFVLAVLALWRHKANIKRLIEGNENKLGAKKAQ